MVLSIRPIVALAAAVFSGFIACRIAADIANYISMAGTVDLTWLLPVKVVALLASLLLMKGAIEFLGRVRTSRNLGEQYWSVRSPGRKSIRTGTGMFAVLMMNAPYCFSGIIESAIGHWKYVELVIPGVFPFACLLLFIVMDWPAFAEALTAVDPMRYRRLAVAVVSVAAVPAGILGVVIVRFLWPNLALPVGLVLAALFVGAIAICESRRELHS